MEIRKPKRLYKKAEPAPLDDHAAYTVLLDGKPIKTPAKQPLAVPTQDLAVVMAEEWLAQDDVIDPFSMPITRLANSAIDRVTPHRADIIDSVTAYGGSDLVCYWAEEPDDLVARQEEAWMPVINWAADHLGLRLETRTGIVHKPQPDETMQAFRHHLEALDNFRLTGVADSVSQAGSLVLGLALLKGYLDADAVFRASQVDEDFQISLWGEDWEQKEKRERLRLDIQATERFLLLL